MKFIKKTIKSYDIIILCFFTAIFLSGCLATTAEISGIRDDMHELQIKLNELHRNQADLFAKLDNSNSNLGPLDSKLDNTQNQISLLNQRLDDIEAGLSQKMVKLSEKVSSTELSETPSPSEIYRLAYSDFSRGKCDVAIVGFKSYLERNQQGELAPQARYYLGECYYSQNNWGKAVREFELVEVDYPRSDTVPASRLKRALCLELLKKRNEANEVFNSIVRDFPDSPEAYTAQEKRNSFHK